MKTKKKYLLPNIFIGILSFTILFSCQKDDVSLSNSDDETEVSSATTNNTVNGIVRIKLTSDAVEQLSVSLKSGSLKTSVTNIDSVISSISATSFTRIFPYSDKFEERTKKAGLDRWYNVKFDSTNTTLATALQKFAALGEISITEPIRKIKDQTYAQKAFDPSAITASLKSSSSEDEPYDDTYLSYQWNLNNDGSMASGAVEGCDINVFNAWKIQTGSEDVIVAVIDGGIDYDHRDLEDNIWINETENSGTSNYDDDGNNYTDDIYGYNFVDENGTIVAHDHGTHVSGSIAARTGNSAGICGIAGGDDTHVGVQLMSCQIFEEDSNGDDTSCSDENLAKAIKYAADNGAVICQNSWGYDGATSTPEAIQDAINYFIEYAGYDENGDQSGPMAGGVVIFAAGNDATSTNAYPAMDDNVIAVGAVGADFTIASYSNYGSWVDIMAPGGEDEWTSQTDNEYILSTITDDYLAWMVGTSMACPQVSGVAALIVSEFGGDGFTPSDLKEKLYQGAVDLDSYNSKYEGMMGAGLINATAALKDAESNVAPDAVDDLTAVASGTTVTLAWTVPEDEDDEVPYGYTIYYSTSDFSTSDIENNSASLSSFTISANSESVGEELTTSISLSPLTEYYFKIASYDILKVYSDYSSSVSVTTGENYAPQFSSEDGYTFDLKSHESKSFTIAITDPEGDSYTWSYTDNNGGSSAVGVSTGVKVTINALSVDPGTYTSTLTATDANDSSSSYTITYTVEENNAPTTTIESDSIYIGDLNSSSSIDLSDYFEDADGEDLSYTIENSSSFVSTSVYNQTLTITPKSKGLTTLTVTASDARDAQTTSTILVMSRDDSEEIDVYPNPVSSTVYFRMGEDVDGTINVKIYNNNGVLKDTRDLSISAFSPASTDLSGLSSGQYLLKITYDNEEIEKNIVKL